MRTSQYAGLHVRSRLRSGSVKEFVCPDHQWTYDFTGRLLGLPFRRGYRGQGGMPADFCPEEHGLQRLAVTSRHGVVFASFGAPDETLETYLGERMLRYFDRVFDGRQLEVLGYMRQRIPSNWKFMFENIKDPYHASLLHVFLVTFGLFRLDQQSAVEMDATGRHAVLVSRRGAQETNEATAQMRAFKVKFALRDQRLLDPVREFPRRRDCCHADAVAQPDRSAAVQHAGHAADRAADRPQLRSGLDVLRFR